MKIPFDVDNKDLMDTFISYIDELFIAKRNEIFKPIYKFEALDELEIYYQKINLYYSFGKIFGPTIDEEWIYEERKNVSEKINNLLLKI